MNYEFYMDKCIELAKLSEGKVSPNPLVGCVIVDDNGEIIAQGRHEMYGQAHAEQNALRNAGDSAKNATLFVNLEPCNHWGKTPPCAKLIIDAGIKKVVVGIRDLNKKASGGIETLRNAGIEVIEGVLEKECKKLNEIFFFSLTHSRPFIAIKTATTLDGKIAAADGSSKWITSDGAREKVQSLRNCYDAILTTASTVLADNPSLTCRKIGGRNPVRIVVDRHNTLNKHNEYKVFNLDGTKVIHHVGDFDEDFCKKLYDDGIKSVLIEAGGKFNASVINLGLADKIYQFFAPKVLCDNAAISWVYGNLCGNINDAINFRISAVEIFEPDIMLELYPKM